MEFADRTRYVSVASSSWFLPRAARFPSLMLARSTSLLCQHCTAATWQMPIESRRGNLEARRDILHTDRGVGKHRFGGGEVLRAERSGPTALLTALTCGLEAGAGALADDGALELSQRTEDVEHEPPARRRCVDALGERAQLDAARLQVLHSLDQLAHRT